MTKRVSTRAFASVTRSDAGSARGQAEPGPVRMAVYHPRVPDVAVAVTEPAR
jgi:hypothetical protein